MTSPTIAFCSKPMRNAPPSGDGWFYCIKAETVRVMVADGLGHGINANRVVLQLIRQMNWLSERSHIFPDITECLHNLDKQLKALNQQGAQSAIALADINTEENEITLASIGNIESYCFNQGEAHRFPAMNGMIGGRMPGHIQIHQYITQQPALFAMFTDGLDSRTAQDYLLRLSSSSRLQKHNAQLIANQVVRAARSLNDDASCAVMLI